MRSDVTLSTIVRVMERLLTKKQASKEDEEHQELLWNYEKAFTNKTSDFFVDIDSGKPLNVVSKEEIITEDTTDSNVPLEPSLLQRLPSRNEKLTTADFLQPTSLVTSNHENKIYGFYYLV